MLGRLIAAALLWAAPGLAETRPALHDCIHQAGAAARLACYDRQAAEAGRRALRAAPSPGEAATWLLTRESDPMDDAETVTIFLRAETGRSRWGKPITLALRCRQKRARAFVIWHDYLGVDHGSIAEGWKAMTVRLGPAPPERQDWLTAPDRKSAYAPGPPWSILGRLLTADRLVVRTTPYGEERPVTAVFDLSGLRDAIAPLESACGPMGTLASEPSTGDPAAG